MDEEPHLSVYAQSLDPADREAVKQFKRVLAYLTVDLAEDLRLQLLDEVNTSMCMLELASITGEAAFRFRREFVIAARAVDQAATDRLMDGFGGMARAG